MAIVVQQSLISVPARAVVERFKVNNSFETVGVLLGLDILLQQHKGPLTRQKIFGTARMKKVRVPKKLVWHR